MLKPSRVFFDKRLFGNDFKQTPEAFWILGIRFETIKSYLAFNILTVLYFKSKIHKDIKELNNSKEIFPII